MRRVVLNGIIGAVILCLGISATHAQNKIHTVETGQTLYSIARSYDITVTDLLKVNPEIEDNIIKIGDELKIPAAEQSIESPQKVTKTPSQAISEKPFTTGNETNQAETTVSGGQIIRNKQFSTISHTVKEKETLYAISRLYGVTIDEIKAWNHIEDNNIQEGSVILIRSGEVAEEIKPVTEAVTEVVTEAVKTEPVSEPVETLKTEEPKPAVKEMPINRNETKVNYQDALGEDFISAQNSGKLLQSARGTISWINTEHAKMSDSFFALHKTIPSGTVIKVTNLVNKRVVFVKVIGKLPQNSDNINVELRISSAAKNALLLNGDKAYVNLEYHQ